jgi:hypothetical protein
MSNSAQLFVLMMVLALPVLALLYVWRKPAADERDSWRRMALLWGWAVDRLAPTCVAILDSLRSLSAPTAITATARRPLAYQRPKPSLGRRTGCLANSIAIRFGCRW